MSRPPKRGPRSVALAFLLGVLIGALLAVAAGIALALLRPESTNVLRPWWH